MIVDTANGTKIGCDDLGRSQDPAVVLIGGLATQRTVWPDTMCDELVAASYRVIRFDNRDMGESTWSRQPAGDDLLRMVQHGLGPEDTLAYTIDDLGDDVVALMDALKIQTAHVVGMSLGGRIAQSVALRHPQRTVGLVSMMSTTGNPALPPSTPAAMTALMTPPSDPFDVTAVTELAQAQQKVIGSPGYAMAGRLRARCGGAELSSAATTPRARCANGWHPPSVAGDWRTAVFPRLTAPNADPARSRRSRWCRLPPARTAPKPIPGAKLRRDRRLGSQHPAGHRAAVGARDDRTFSPQPRLKEPEGHVGPRLFSFDAIDGEGRRSRSTGTRGQAGPDRQHRQRVRLHAAIRGPTKAVADLPRPGPRGARRAVERLRRPGAGDGVRQSKTFCTTKVPGGFPDDREASGDRRSGAHPFYQWIASTVGEDAAPKWNFHKYLVGPDGAAGRQASPARSSP